MQTFKKIIIPKQFKWNQLPVMDDEIEDPVYLNLITGDMEQHPGGCVDPDLLLLDEKQQYDYYRLNVKEKCWEQDVSLWPSKKREVKNKLPLPAYLWERVFAWNLLNHL